MKAPNLPTKKPVRTKKPESVIAHKESLSPRGARKTSKEKPRPGTITRSVNFRDENIEFVLSHDLHTKRNVSISWIINELIVQFKKGNIKIEVPLT